MIDVGLIGFGLAGRISTPADSRRPGVAARGRLQHNSDDADKIYPDDSHCVHLERGTPGHRFQPAGRNRLTQPDAFPLRHTVPEGRSRRSGGQAHHPYTSRNLELFRIARKSDRLLTVFQSRRFDADFRSRASGRCSARGIGRIVRFDTITIVTAPVSPQMPGENPRPWQRHGF